MPWMRSTTGSALPAVRYTTRWPWRVISSWRGVTSWTDGTRLGRVRGFGFVFARAAAGTVTSLLRGLDDLAGALQQRLRGVLRQLQQRHPELRTGLAPAPELRAQAIIVAGEVEVQRALRRLVGKGTTDDHPLDLARALEDRVELRVAVPLLDRQVAHVSPAAADLDRLLGRAHGDLRGHELRHRALAELVVHAGGRHPGRAPHEQPRRV